MMAEEQRGIKWVRWDKRRNDEKNVGGLGVRKLWRFVEVGTASKIMGPKDQSKSTKQSQRSRLEVG